MRRSREALIPVLLLGTSLALAGSVLAAETSTEESPPEPQTVGDSTIALEDLESLVKPLTKDELVVEADAWLNLLRGKVEDITAAQIQINRKNREIEVVGEISARTERGGADTAENRATVAIEALSVEAKSKALADLKALRNERTALIDRLNAVLDELTAKIGRTPEGRDPEEVMAYRRYVDAVSGIVLDVSDTQAATATILGWLASEQGGIRWANNILLFLGIVLSFWVLGLLASKAVAKALDVAKVSSTLLRNFLVRSARRVILAVGLLMGLSALEVNVGPLLALIGAAGFVVAFALQNTLSNFASGIMIMFYKPYDVGNFVDVAGIAGTVKSMNLVSTAIATVDNKLMVVPNNSIWGNIITNVTGSSERRVDMMFSIGYDDDIDAAERILREIVAEHALVLAKPEPVIQLHELGASSVNFIVRPWARTADYFAVFWDITRRVKKRFDEEGISIPYPQQDVHVYHTSTSVEPGSTSRKPGEPFTKETKITESPADDGA